jgi:hypothetical protein
MKNIFLALCLTCILQVTSQTEISLAHAKTYIDNINTLLAGDELYIRADVSSFSGSDPVNPNDIGEFTVARKSGCTYTRFKEQESYIHGSYAVNLDTVEQSIVVSDAVVTPYSKIDIRDLGACKSISMIQLKGSNYMLVFAMKPGKTYEQVQILFDTTTNRLQKINMTFEDRVATETDTKKIEILYREVSHSVPAHIHTCMAADIVRVSRHKQVEIKEKKYRHYTIINLLDI